MKSGPWICALLLATLCRDAAAQDRVTGTAILLLPIGPTGAGRDPLNEAVARRLRRLGETVRIARKGPATESCRSQECLDRIGLQYRADRVLGGTVVGGDGSQRIELWLYERGSGGDLAQEQGTCESCEAEALQEMVAQLAGKLITAGSAAEGEPVVQPAPPPPRVVAEPPAVSLVAPGRAPGLSGARKGAAAGLGVLLFATATAAVTVTVLHGQPVRGGCVIKDVQHASCDYSLVPYMVIGHVGAGLLGGAFALTLSWPQKKQGARR